MRGFGSRAHSIFRISIVLVVCVLAAVETSYGTCPLAGPQATYQFVGQCTDCSGTGVGALTVQNYTLGDTLTGCNLVNFTYTSNLTSFTITGPGYLSGTLPVSLPAAAAVSVNDSTNGFSSNVNGNWFVGLLDLGTGGIWSLPSTSTVPTLSTAALCALGLLLAGAGALLVRRQVRGSAGA